MFRCPGVSGMKSSRHVLARQALRWVRLGLTGLLAMGLWARAEERVPLFTYYTDPPFDAVSTDNLTRKLADWLNMRSQGRYHFVATGLPRSEIDAIVQQPGWRGAVAWVNPAWFGQQSALPLMWSQPFMQDSNSVVSRAGREVSFLDDGASLAGRKVCKVTGRRVTDLQWLFDAGRAQLVDAPSERGCLQSVQEGRADAALLQTATWVYWQQHDASVVAGLVAARQPRNTFGRHLVLAAGQEQLFAFLQAQLADVAKDPGWLRVLPNPPRQLRLVSVVPPDRADARALRRTFDEVFERAGLRYSVAWRPAERAVAEFRAGRFDGDMGRPAAYAPTLHWAVRVDPPYARSSIVLLVKAGTEVKPSPDVLRQMQILIPKGYKLLEQRAQGLDRHQFVVSPLVCARMVREGRATACMTITDIGGSWVGQKELGQDLQALPLETLDLHIWLAAGLEHEAQQIGRAIESLRRTGELQKLTSVGDAR